MPECENIGCHKKMTYCGQHWDMGEGWSSTYSCSRCNGITNINKRIRAWNKHLDSCKKEFCERCGKSKGHPDVAKRLELLKGGRNSSHD